jgi:pyruvate formate lyase activating enzyme
MHSPRPGRMEQSADRLEPAALVPGQVFKTQRFNETGGLRIQARRRVMIVKMTQIGADDDKSLRSSPKQLHHLGDLVRRRVADGKRNEFERSQDLLQKRHMHLETVLAGVGCVVDDDLPKRERLSHRLSVDRHASQRCHKCVAAGNSQSGNAHKMRRTEQNHALDAIPQAPQDGMGRSRNGTRVDVSRMGGDNSLGRGFASGYGLQIALNSRPKRVGTCRIKSTRDCRFPHATHDRFLRSSRQSIIVFVHPSRRQDVALSDSSIVATKYWHRLEDGRVQCDVCPRYCKLHEGQRGFCFVRACQDDQVVLTTYGRSSGYCIDPIEKKPLNHFLPGTPVLSFGTAGCNLGCKFCQNWDISKSREIDTLADAATPELIAKAAKQLGCRSVAFTYNDPVIFMEYAIDVAKACHAEGIKSVAVTAGEMCEEPRAEFYSHMDAANVDLKGFTEEFYHEVCAGHLQPVLDLLVYLKHHTKVWFEITTLLIPGANDSDGEIDAETKWIVKNLGPDVPLHFTAFHPDFRMLDKPPTPPATLTRARSIALANGIHFAYTGNVRDGDGGSTWCPGCGKRLIEREWYVLGEWNLTRDGRCSDCGTAIAGHFERRPGTWGARRAPVRLSDFASRL